ncbi:MAG TPA: YdiU family protein [Verrucomicrobia bacterium]|nr:YdiU family protein [Verrucomicrobiota bacterium]
MHWNFHQTYTQLPTALFSRVVPATVPQPKLGIINHALALDMGLDPELLSSPSGIAELAGCKVPPGADPIAQAYAGHQFGSFTMLGDGRAIVLGEHVDPSGGRRDVQLKGSGLTPYSRSGDGKAALGPMLREYVISEAMHAMGIPTTRSLAVVTTGERVYRETPLAGAVLTRIALSHIRVGTFQYAAALQDPVLLKTLADYTINRHFPELSDSRIPYTALLEGVMRRQIALMTAWMNVGFIHGVMNTDNMAISGETIDYGPCAFMDRYDPATVFSSIDRYGRYAFGNQPAIVLWNLSRFAETLLPLVNNDRANAVEQAKAILSSFEQDFNDQWSHALRKKLGLFNTEDGDRDLAETLLEWMKLNRRDYVNTFRSLMDGMDAPAGIFIQHPSLLDWWKSWEERRKRQSPSSEESLRMMQRATPAIIPRNHHVEMALRAASVENDFQPLKRLIDALQAPYSHERLRETYQDPAPVDALPYYTFCGT